MKRIIAAILLAVMLLSLIACEPGTNPPETTSDKQSTPGGSSEPGTTEPETTEPVTTEDPHRQNNLPEVNFDNETFRWLGNGTYNGESPTRDLVYLEDVQTNSINEAVRERNDYVQDKYGVRIEAVWADNGTNMLDTARKSCANGMNTYDFLEFGFLDMATMIDLGYLVNLNSLQYLDLSREYWNQKCRQDMSIAHALYFMAGDILTTDKEGCWSVQFNRDLITQFNLESPYDHVDNYTWTYEDMYQYMQAVCDYEMHDPADTFGITWGNASETNNTYFLWQGSGTKLIVKDPITDIPSLGELTDNSYDAILGVAKVQFDSTLTILQHQIKGVTSNTEGIIKIFCEGKSLFKVGSVSMVEWMRAYDTDFGILPLPMLNEEQHTYYSSQSQGYAMAIAMGTCCLEDPIPGKSFNHREFASFVVEALACESTDTVLDGYYEKTLRYKGLRREEDERMLDLVFASRVYDLSLVFSWASPLTTAIGNAKTEAAVRRLRSSYDSYANSVGRAITQFLDKHGLA
ncbi:MAG: hypothetical protein II797_05205 [Clostridia bacterium]|nr:hypothetical protein [Clostridia bacterium]